MKTIHKYPLKVSKELNELSLREGFKIVRCEYIVSEKTVYLWVEEPLKVDIPECRSSFRVAFSGEPVPDHYLYRGTALDPFGPEAYHVFEAPERKASTTTDRPMSLRPLIAA
ncbi:DUF7352 domain-containing protein [Marinobacter mobilis]|uniref:DUF7352 domain-containing protein n=1 Tax=Marinobacter mobilis TaxID=488533 RepID=A0A1H2S4T3_9GAMM|nr:hypothetical protein [Marinobacter mobilis]SDW26702.1 hypothetical protein SAMN04487960_10225 [Marinobacter mobilis]